MRSWNFSLTQEALSFFSNRIRERAISSNQKQNSLFGSKKISRLKSFIFSFLDSSNKPIKNRTLTHQNSESLMVSSMRQSRQQKHLSKLI